jgi:hypothetical protein
MSAKQRFIVPVPLTAAASARRDSAAAERLLSRAIDLFAAEVPIPPTAITSAGIPISGGKTMMDAQKFRVNWYALERKQLGRIARLVAARNWFAAPVHRLNKCLYGGGFQLKDAAARKWAAEGTYPFKRIHDDILHEYLIAVRWAPVLYGQDAGRGTIVEVIIHGSVTRHGMTKHATPADPLLDIKVHGKNLQVIRHGSSGIPA